MATKAFNNKMFDRTQVLSALVLERFLSEGKSRDTASVLVAGYMQSFLLNLLCENYTQKEKLACVNTRIFMQEQSIARANSIRS